MASWLQDPSPAFWLRDSLDPAGRTVTSFVPAGYEGYVRVLNPVVVDRLDGVPDRIKWSTAAASVAAPVHAWMQWDETVVAAEGHLPERWAEPAMGDLNPMVAATLAEVLGRHTTTPDSCFFAAWEGYGDPAAHEGLLVTFPPGRRMKIHAGPVQDGTHSLGEGLFGRCPLRWWPEDRAWCVGQDIYARSVFIAAGKDCIKDLFAHPGLDTHSIRPTDPVYPEDF